MAVAVSIPELAIVEFTHEVGGHPSGAVGVVVSAHPDEDVYTIELVDAAGRTVDLVAARAEDLRVTHVV
ncbi:MAG TPA: DUF4926 domain-containing protein [Gaiellaceae bacterium]|nr:DUF4926 domain-containing protein [Gaiellaceae bacterium]